MLFCAHRLTVLTAFVGLLGMASSAWAQDAQPSGTDGPAPVLVPGLSMPSAAPAAGSLPSVELTAEIMFQILASEIAAQRGAFTPAANTLMELARVTHDPRLARRAAEFSLAGGDLGRALEATREWSSLDPGDTDARQATLALSAAAGRIDGLGAALRARIAASPDKTAAVGEARRVLARLDDKKRAFAVLEEALTDVRDLPIAHMALSRAAALAGDDSRAAAEANAALAAQPDSEVAAMLALQTGFAAQPEQSVTRARAFIQAHPDSRNLRILLARALADQKDYGGASAELQTLARANPEDFEIVYLQGVLAYQSGKPDQADAFFTQYLSVSDQRAGSPAGPLADADNAVYMRVQIAEDQKRYDDAYTLLDRLADTDAQFTARLRQAALRAKQGRIDDARKVLADISPRSASEGIEVAQTEAHLLRLAGQREEAVKVLEAANARYPDTPDIMYDLSMLYEQQDRVADMETLLRKVIELQPDHAQAYNALGYSLAERNLRLPEAKQLIERALGLLPNDPFIIDSMGWVYYRMGDPTRALGYLQRAYQLRPDVEIGVHLGEVLWVSGQQTRALDLWRQVQIKDPGNAELQATLARLNVAL